MKFIELENFKIKNRSNYSYSLSTNLVHDFMTHHANDDHNSNQAKYSLINQDNYHFLTLETNSNLSRSSNLKIKAVKVPMKSYQRSDRLKQECSSIQTLNITENVSPDLNGSKEETIEKLNSHRTTNDDISINKLLRK